MRFLTSIAFALSVAVAQEVGVTDSDKVSAGASAIDSPNVNNGVQVESSLFASGSGAGKEGVFDNIFNSHFMNAHINVAADDNLVNNPSFTSLSGDSGWIANGDSNLLGPLENLFSKRGGAAYHSSAPYHAPATAPYNAPAKYHRYLSPYAAVAPILVPAPVHYYPVFHTHPPPSAPYKAPVHEAPAPKYNAPAEGKPAYKSTAPVEEKPDYKHTAPIEEKPDYKHTAPVVDKPAPAYQAPAAEKPAPSYEAPAYHGAAPIVSKQATQSATIIQNQV
ncbi:hypothetical protein IWW36_005919 [Coemansia brasiliensis]|uniref:Uncharacterized protein n=1 Tax=Coemansia brasiliensis TaxID=2650707 RepID=A0A9W8I2Z9_9FUNG|nr:hypothetical protein IWW36_005919 [Coemansia brasiliensis]